jgi:sugar phosphate isomerase/epimerase
LENVKFSVFTKPWRTQSLDELGELVASFGFDAVEYPLRGGYQVQPQDGAAGIKRLVTTLKKHGVAVTSIAGGVDVAAHEGEGKGEVTGSTRELFEACGENGIGVVRICQGFDKNLDFQANVSKLRFRYDAVAEIAEKTGVTLGVQMHFGQHCVFGSFDTKLLLKNYDKKHVSAVWDAGHSGLAGENPRYALEVLWPHLSMVNFKAAYWHSKTGPEAAKASFGVKWTTGPYGMCDWKAAVDYLKERGYKGTVCLPAEYSDEPNVDAYTRFDIDYIKGLFAD